MPRRSPLLAPVALLAVLALSGVAVAQDEAVPAPDFQLETIIGEADGTNLAELRGRLVLLEFSATW